MEAILPFKIKNEQKYFQSALKLGFDEMEIYKFIYVMQQSDMDVFPKMHDERINVLIYCWELCEDYKHQLSPDEWELPEELETILKLLVPWSLDIWFSKEWDKCKPYLRQGLIHCLNRARDLLMRMPDMMQINWDFLLLYNLTPWNVDYLRNLNVTKEKTLETGAQSIETEEQVANSDDLLYVKLEQLPLIVLRLIKLFDQCSIDMVKTLCMRVIAAWNKIYQTELQTTRRPPYIPPEDKRCLLLICHIYLMAVYEADDVKGYVIDNLINNIRFYFQGFQTSTALYAMDNLEYTPARFIALTAIHLRLKKSEFFDFFIWKFYDTSLVNLFGVVSQAYKSYLLGNLLMELNNMNEDDFALNVPLYKRLMNSYVNEREKSELFLLNELDKLEIQRFAHNITTVKKMTDFKSKICKGNRMSNIGNYENSDDIIAPAVDDAVKDVGIKETACIAIKEEDDSDLETVASVKDKESDLRLDPIFQNIPNNENILYYVYEVLAKKDYKGWHFAKIVLLVKIIGHELNMIETWRYHPGLTTDFMLNLETKLSNHYADLAKIFKDHAFIEQEFWLTAFYLNPASETYETIKRLGMRNNRKRTDEHTKLVMSIDNIDAKYGLLSSTIDVKEIANLANTEEPDGDYDPLFSALKSLHLPDSLIKDMLTAIFLPRNKSFAWIIDWTELRTRCKVLLNNSKEKKRFVELNMAEANERLKFLNIDYEKYKNRPQLDYGTIEAGYENLMNSADFDRSDDDDEEEEEDFEDDEDVYESHRSSRGRGAAEIKKEQEKMEDENSQEEDPYLTGKRRTRARVAATVASYLFQSIPRATRRIRNKNNELVSRDEYKDEQTKADNEKDNTDDNERYTDDKSNDSKSPITTSESLAPSPIPHDSKDIEDPDIIKKNIKECLNERPSFNNSTPYFQPLIDIWNVEKSEMQSIDNNCVSLLESSMVLRRMAKLKLLNKQTNPLGCNEHEAIDETEMLIINTDFPMTKISSVEKETKHNMVKSTSETIIKIDNAIVAKESFIHKDIEMITENICDESSQEKEDDEISRTKDMDMITEVISDDEDKEADETSRTKDIELIPEVISDESCEEKESKYFREDAETRREKDIEMITEIILEESSEEKESKDLKEDEFNEIMEVDEINDASIPKEFSDFEVPVQKSDDVNKNQETPSTEDYSIESIKSIMSTSTAKGSEYVSELNFKINSKLISENTDSNEIEDSAEKMIKDKTKKDQNTDIEKENNKEEKEIKDQNKEYKSRDENQSYIEIFKETNQDLEEESTKYSNISDTELSKETKDDLKQDFIESTGDLVKELHENSNKSNIKVIKESEEDLVKDFLTENLNKSDTELSQESNDLAENSNITDTEILKDIPDELNNDETNDLKRKYSDLPVITDETVITKDSKKFRNDDTEICNTSEDQVSELITKDLKIDETAKSEDLQSQLIKESNFVDIKESKLTSKDSNNIDTEMTEQSKDTESEVITNKSNIIDKNDTASKLITQHPHIVDTESTISELITKDSNIIYTEMPAESKVTESELTTKDSKNTEDTPTKLIINDSNIVDTERTEESKTIESELVTKYSKKTDAKIANDSELKSLDLKNINTEITNESKDTKSELLIEDPKNRVNEVLEESIDKTTEIDKSENSELLLEDCKYRDNTKLEEPKDETSFDDKLDNTVKLCHDPDNTTSKEDDHKSVSNQASKEEFSTSDDISMDSLKFHVDDNDSTDDEIQKSMKEICLTKRVRVVVRKLRPADLVNLRQPKIKVKRINVGKCMEEFKAIRFSAKRAYLAIDDSSNNSSAGTTGSSDAAYRPPKTKSKIPPRRHSLRQPRTSESENDSNNSEDVKLMNLISARFIRKRRLSTSTGSIQHTSSSSSSTIGSARHHHISSSGAAASSSANSNLIVTPRSASGLKLRISNAEQSGYVVPRKKLKRSLAIDDVIQLSSSSEDGSRGGSSNTLTPIDEVIELDNHPLFEEEILF